MKLFEVSNRKSKNGRRKFKLVLHEIYPDSCIDEIDEVGRIFNLNGITWIEEFVQKNLDTVKDMSLRVEFADDERVEIIGHGETGVEDGLPLFENATEIGHFTEAKIEDIDDNGITKRCLIGYGYIDEMCYPRFVAKLMDDIRDGYTTYGSVEIYRSEDNEGIEYKYGYKEDGRIPMNYIYSGYALLGIRPADSTAKLLEINSKGDEKTMGIEEVKALIGDVVAEALKSQSEINKCKEDCASEISKCKEDCTSEISKCKEECDSEIAKCKEECDSEIAKCKEECSTACGEKDTEISKCKEEIEAANNALTTCESEKEALVAEKNSLIEEKNALVAEINSLKDQVLEFKKAAKVTELNKAIADFSDSERMYAKDEIDSFMADPIASEINAVVDKIYKGIGMVAKSVAKAKTVAEHNSAKKTEDEDIYADVALGNKADVSIY